MNKEKSKEQQKKKTSDCEMKPCDRYTIFGDEPFSEKAVSLFNKPRNKKPTDPEPELKVKPSSNEKNKQRNPFFHQLDLKKEKEVQYRKKKVQKKK